MGNKDDELTTICELIQRLDGIRAFDRTENLRPEIVKDNFKRLKDRYMREKWRIIREDIEKLVYLPLEIAGLPRMIRWITYLKIIIPITMIFTILSIPAPVMGRSIIPMPRFFSLIGLILPMIAISMLMVLDRKIRTRVVRYEMEHAEGLQMSRKRIKSVIQELITRLIERLERRSEEPDLYKMELFYKDYKNIRIIKERRGKIFRRKHTIYTVVPARSRGAIKSYAHF